MSCSPFVFTSPASNTFAFDISSALGTQTFTSSFGITGGDDSSCPTTSCYFVDPGVPSCAVDGSNCQCAIG